MCGIIYLCECSPYIQCKYIINSLAECTAKLMSGFFSRDGRKFEKGVEREHLGFTPLTLGSP